MPTLTISDLLAKAKAAIKRGESAMREAAEYIAAAQQQGVTQREIAERVGKSAAWVNTLLAWRRNGYRGEVFARWKRPVFSQAKQGSDRTKKTKKAGAAKAEDAKAEAERERANAEDAKAEARRARNEARRYRTAGQKQIHKKDRDRLVGILGMLGSDKDGEALSAARQVEALRKKLAATWDELIVIEVEEVCAA